MRFVPRYRCCCCCRSSRSCSNSPSCCCSLLLLISIIVGAVLQQSLTNAGAPGSSSNSIITGGGGGGATVASASSSSSSWDSSSSSSSSYNLLPYYLRGGGDEAGDADAGGGGSSRSSTSAVAEVENEVLRGRDGGRSSSTYLAGSAILEEEEEEEESDRVSGSSNSEDNDDDEVYDEEEDLEEEVEKQLELLEGEEDLEEEEEEEENADAGVVSMSRIRRSIARKRLEFLDRIALISTSLLQREKPIEDDETESDFHHGNDDEITPQSDLSRPGRHFHIVTTAALPWFTGTAVNPLLRAATLHRRTQQINNNNSISSNNNNSTSSTTSEQGGGGRWVTLVVPWLELDEDQMEVYGKVFENENEQERYIRTWLREAANMPDAADPQTGLIILFYPARYHHGLRSVFAMGDPISLMMKKEKKDSSSSQETTTTKDEDNDEDNTNNNNIKMDVCILEEPEHINWYRHPGDGWTKRFNYVVGIIHTNYKEYARSKYYGLWTAPALTLMCSAMVRAYCHKVIRLSPVLQSYAPEKEETSNIHGVRTEFLQEGIRRQGLDGGGWQHQVSVTGSSPEHAQAYFIGKLLWDKGLDIMLDLEDYYKATVGEYFPIDIYGNGPDRKDIVRAYHGRELIVRPKSPESNKKKRKRMKKRKNMPKKQKQNPDNTLLGGNDESSVNGLGFRAAKRKLTTKINGIPKIEEIGDYIPKTLHELRRTPIPANFPGRVDHAELTKYKVFVNPSISEVLCTTTAEALAMGKFVVVPVHPSNTFFYQFPNCLAYRNRFEFVANLRWAFTHDPEPLSEEHSRQLTWEAATDRLLEASAITWGQARKREKLGITKVDERIAWLHNEIGKGVTGDMIRKILGAGPASDQVKYMYELESQQVVGVGDVVDGEDITDEELVVDAEDEDDGLSPKFRSSSFAENIRATIADLSSFLQ